MTKPIEVHSHFDESVARIVDLIDGRMSQLNAEEMIELNSLIDFEVSIGNPNDLTPRHIVKLAALLGLKMAHDISRQRDKAFTAVATSN